MEQNGGAHRTRSHTAKLLPCKKERLGSFLFLKSNNKGKRLQIEKASLHPQQGAILGSVLSFSEGYTTKKIGESSSVVKESH